LRGDGKKRKDHKKFVLVMSCMISWDSIRGMKRRQKQEKNLVIQGHGCIAEELICVYHLSDEMVSLCGWMKVHLGPVWVLED
jgi:hypothetical protein